MLKGCCCRTGSAAGSEQAFCVDVPNFGASKSFKLLLCSDQKREKAPLLEHKDSLKK